jgi:hypothetical protein
MLNMTIDTKERESGKVVARKEQNISFRLLSVSYGGFKIKATIVTRDQKSSRVSV